MGAMKATHLHALKEGRHYSPRIPHMQPSQILDLRLEDEKFVLEIPSSLKIFSEVQLRKDNLSRFVSHVVLK